MSDIMSENQTESVLALLDRGEADDKTRDRVSAALLRSQTRLLEELSEVKDHLWKPRDLEDLVDRRHAELCASCPTKAIVERMRAETSRAPAKKTWVEALLTSDSLRYFILILILVWAVVYLKAGPEGVAAVKDAATSVVPR